MPQYKVIDTMSWAIYLVPNYYIYWMMYGGDD